MNTELMGDEMLLMRALRTRRGKAGRLFGSGRWEDTRAVVANCRNQVASDKIVSLKEKPGAKGRAGAGD